MLFRSNSDICEVFNILRCKSDNSALQWAGEISSRQNFLLQYPHPCPQDCYTQSYVVAIPKVLGSNFWFSGPVDRGVRFLQFFLSVYRISSVFSCVCAPPSIRILLPSVALQVLERCIWPPLMCVIALHWSPVITLT